MQEYELGDVEMRLDIACREWSRQTSFRAATHIIQDADFWCYAGRHYAKLIQDKLFETGNFCIAAALVFVPGLHLDGDAIHGMLEHSGASTHDMVRYTQHLLNAKCQQDPSAAFVFTDLPYLITVADNKRRYCDVIDLTKLTADVIPQLVPSPAALNAYISCLLRLSNTNRTNIATLGWLVRGSHAPVSDAIREPMARWLGTSAATELEQAVIFGNAFQEDADDHPPALSLDAETPDALFKTIRAFLLQDKRHTAARLRNVYRDLGRRVATEPSYVLYDVMYRLWNDVKLASAQFLENVQSVSRTELSLKTLWDHETLSLDWCSVAAMLRCAAARHVQDIPVDEDTLRNIKSRLEMEPPSVNKWILLYRLQDIARNRSRAAIARRAAVGNAAADRYRAAAARRRLLADKRKLGERGSTIRPALKTTKTWRQVYSAGAEQARVRAVQKMITVFNKRVRRVRK